MAAVMWAIAGQALAEGPGAAVTELASHRATYELTLDHTNAGSNVSDIQGQLIYDFAGSSCQGYSLNTRLVTEIFDRDGKATTTDVRSQSFEDAGGTKYRFTNSQYVNNKLTDTTKGSAIRRIRDVLVELEKPKRMFIPLSHGVFFPTQHSIAILKAAQAGQTRVQADIYDGSEKGTKVYETATLIAAPLELSANTELPAVKNADALNNLPSWPVIVSYYEPGQSQDGLPAYEVSFRMYANGVSRKLKLDYGTFSLNGELSSIEFFEQKPCR